MLVLKKSLHNEERRKSKQPEIILLTKNVTLFGRQVGKVDVVIDSALEQKIISRIHASISREEHGVKIKSLGTNGILVNRFKVAETMLHDGDEIVFGGSASTPVGTEVTDLRSELIYQFSIHKPLPIGPPRDQSKRISPSTLCPPIVIPPEKKSRSLQVHLSSPSSRPSMVFLPAGKSPLPGPVSPFFPSSTTSSNCIWNRKFQETLDMKEATDIETLQKYQMLTQLATDFLSMASTYGRTIIAEQFVPLLQRSIRPQQMKGFAGGTKYLVRGILFKLTTDSSLPNGQFLYGGSEASFEAAAKVADHELKGAINYFQWHSIGLRVPMQALVDYCGFRLIAMPEIPLSHQHPLYGSDDSGKNIYAENKKFNEMMKEVAGHLHLASHLVGDKELYSAGDVEGHQGQDDRMYLLDLARAFPPESPYDTPHLPKHHQSVLFRLLRPEFLHILREREFPPLSPDAFTGWGASNSKHHNENVRKATQYLISQIIPDFAVELTGQHYNYRRRSRSASEETPESQTPSHVEDCSTFTAHDQLEAPFSSSPDGIGAEELRHLRLSEELHSHGINMRHLGLLRHVMRTKTQSDIISRSPGMESEMSILLLVEMVARTLKNLLRDRLRRTLSASGSQSEDQCVNIAVIFLNLVTGFDSKHEIFWKEEVVAGVQQRYGSVALTEEEKQDLFGCTSRHLVRVIDYVTQMTGVELSADCQMAFRKQIISFEFTSVDISIQVKVKKMSIIDYAHAKVLLSEAQGRTGSSSQRLLQLAVERLDLTRHAEPLNYACKLEARKARSRLLAVQRVQNDSLVPERKELQEPIPQRVIISRRNSSKTSLKKPNEKSPSRPLFSVAAKNLRTRNLKERRH